MKAKLITQTHEGITWDSLMFVCPGCVAGGPEGYEGVHTLPVNSEVKQPSWTWNGDLEKPTLMPSIKSQGYCLCHSFLTDGLFKFLDDCDHPLVGQSVPMPDLPEWATELSEDDGEEDG